MNRPASLEHIAREPQRLEPPAGATERVFLGKTNGENSIFMDFFGRSMGLEPARMFFFSIWETPAMEMGIQWAFANNKGFEPAKMVH